MSGVRVFVPCKGGSNQQYDVEYACYKSKDDEGRYLNKFNGKRG